MRYSSASLHLPRLSGRLNVSLTIVLPEEMETRLHELCQNTGRSKTDYVLDALNEHLGDMEYLLIAENRLADLRAGPSHTYTLEEVERELGLAD